MVYQGYIKLTIVDSFFVNKASNNNGKKNFDWLDLKRKQQKIIDYGCKDIFLQ